MKNIFACLAAAMLILSACKKDPIDPLIHLPVPPAYMDSLQAYLKMHTNAIDYSSLDLTRCVLSKQGKQWFWKLAIRKNNSAFCLLQSDSVGHVTMGKWVALSALSIDNGLVNGRIVISALDRSSSMRSKIINGYIEALHPSLFTTATKVESHPDPYEPLQEVIVVGYRPSAANGYSINTYMLLQSIMSDNGGGGFYDAAIYTPSGDGPASTPSNDQVQDATGINMADDITLNIEKSTYLPAIDIVAWLKCFQTIPDEGASFTLTLCGDLPVDDDPSVNVNLYTGATGHCFLQIQKTNGPQSITQVLGFTAQNALSALFNAEGFVPSKTVDNAGHKYDASITMQVNASAFATALDKIQELATTLPYSLTRFDCLDWGLAVLNSIRGNNPLVLPHAPIPGNVYTQISTGERLYDFLSAMKEQGGPESPNIYTGGPVWAGSSHGPCNE